MIIELPMDYKFVIPKDGEEPYIINSYGEKVVAILVSDTAIAKAVYAAMQKQIEQLEMNIATLKGEVELLENLSKLSGVTDGGKY
jgi:hypothetical protein